MKKFITIFLLTVVSIITLRSSGFLYQSLDWSLAYCIDMVLMKFFAWSLDRGYWPYTDVYTYNLPMTIYINWFALKIFGNSSWGFRLLDVSWLVLLGGITFIYLKKKSTLAALIGLSLCLTLGENATNFGAFQRETMMLPFWMLSLISYDRIRLGKSEIFHGFLLGIYICISILIKPTGLLLLFFILISLLWIKISESKFSLKETTQFYFSIFVGGCLILFLSILPFLIHGTLLSSISGWFGYFKDLSTSLEILSWQELVGSIFTFSPMHWFIPLNEPVEKFQTNGHLSLFHLFLMLFYVYLLAKKKVDLGPFLILISGFLNYIIQAKGFAYHLFPVWFSCILIVSYLIHFLFQFIQDEENWKKGISSFAIIIMGITLVNQQIRCLKLYKGTGLYTEINQTKKERVHVKVLETLKQINSEFVNKPTSIQVFEAYHSITLNSVMDENMMLVSKYPEAYIFYNESPIMEKYKMDMMGSLESKRPDIIVLNREGTFRIKKDLYQTFPALETFLRDYKLRAEIKEINNVTYTIFTKI